jgi:hypothetical protein
MDNKLDHLKKLEIGYEDTGQTEVKSMEFYGVIDILRLI